MPSTSSVGHSLSSCPSTSCPQHSPQIRCCWSRTPSLHRRKAAPAAACSAPQLPWHWDHPSTGSSCCPGRLKHRHGCTKESRAPQADQPAMAECPSGKDKIIIHWKGCCRSGFAPAWQCRCPACPREASLDHPTQHTRGGAGSKWHWDHCSAMCSPRVSDSSPQIFNYSQP